MRLIILTLFFSSLGNAFAANFSVTNTGNSGAGTLRQAILDANALGGGPHNITFTASYPFSGTIQLQSDLPLISATDVRFHGSDRDPTIDGGGNHSMLLSNVGVSLTVEDMSFQFGVRANGGCISTFGTAGSGSLTVRRSIFNGCLATAPGLSGGGAIHWIQQPPSLVTIEDSGFFDNTVVTTDTATEQARGGAVYIQSEAAIRRTEFRDNSVQSAGNLGGYGGAVSLSVPASTNSEIVGCTFDSNSVDAAVTFLGRGGAVRATVRDGSLLTLQGNYFSENSARFGGAVYILEVTGTGGHFFSAVNNSFVENQATVAGGAVGVENVALGMQHNTFVFNDAPSGSHLLLDNLDVSPFVHNVLADPGSDPACDLTDTTLPGGAIFAANLFEQACGVLSSVGGSISNNLEVMEFDTGPPVGVVKFLPGTDPIDGGTLDGSNCLNVDARGNPRPVDGDGDGVTACDVGAYEQLEQAFFKDGYEVLPPPRQAE